MLIHRSLLLSIAFTAFVAFSACDTYSYKTPPLTDAEMKENPRVYGDVGGPARQSLNKYETNPDAATRSAVLKEKLFSDDTKKAIKIDTAAAMARQVE